MNIGREKKLIITLVLLIVASLPSYAESLFATGISENHAYSCVQPRSLYNSGVAKTVGDIVTIELNETITTDDSMKYKLERDSKIKDSFSPLINRVFLPKAIPIPGELNGFGGGQNVSNNVTRNRTVTYRNTISTQVTQVLPNGNLLVQGKKATISNGEKINLIISGIVDPRWITRAGTVDSGKVANLQMAIVGDGTVSRSDNEGLINKFVRFLF